MPGRSWERRDGLPVCFPPLPIPPANKDTYGLTTNDVPESRMTGSM